jgi:hypothetical protein
LEILEFAILGPHLDGGLLNSFKEGVTQLLQTCLVRLECVDLGLDFFDLALATGLEQ